MNRREEIERELHAVFYRHDGLVELMAEAEPGSREAKWLTEEIAAGAMKGMILTREAMDEEEQ